MCELTSGFLLDCKEGIGGIKEVLLCKHSEVATGYTLDGTTQQIDSLPTVTLYRYELKGASNTFTETITSSEDNGNVFFQQEVTMILSTLTYQKRKELQNVIKNHRLAVFVRDMNDNIWFVGRKDGAQVSAGSAATGGAKGDLNGYTLTFSAGEPFAAERLETFTTVPFDNFLTVTVSPAYVVQS